MSTCYVTIATANVVVVVVVVVVVGVVVVIALHVRGQNAYVMWPKHTQTPIHAP